jgi:hypothetical protein
MVCQQVRDMLKSNAVAICQLVKMISNRGFSEKEAIVWHDDTQGRLLML